MKHTSKIYMKKALLDQVIKEPNVQKEEKKWDYLTKNPKKI